MIWTLFLDALKLILLGLVVLYAALVLITLRTEGAHYQLSIDQHNPVRSAERLLVWIGVRMIAGLLAALNAGLNILEDASADVGDWVLHRHSS
ncbi:MAG TPA: hypothetical protein VMW51_10680 [Terriglobia bacterium]|nr:hypothetical protein [Terriglobia bacterium]